MATVHNTQTKVSYQCVGCHHNCSSSKRRIFFVLERNGGEPCNNNTNIKKLGKLFLARHDVINLGEELNEHGLKSLIL